MEAWSCPLHLSLSLHHLVPPQRNTVIRHWLYVTLKKNLIQEIFFKEIILKLCFNPMSSGKSAHIVFSTPLAQLPGWWPDPSFLFDIVNQGVTDWTSRQLLAVLLKSRFEPNLDQDEKLPFAPVGFLFLALSVHTFFYAFLLDDLTHVLPVTESKALLISLPTFKSKLTRCHLVLQNTYSLPHVGITRTYLKLFIILNFPLTLTGLSVHKNQVSPEPSPCWHQLLAWRGPGGCLGLSLRGHLINQLERRLTYSFNTYLLIT